MGICYLCRWVTVTREVVGWVTAEAPPPPTSPVKPLALCFGFTFSLSWAKSQGILVLLCAVCLWTYKRIGLHNSYDNLTFNSAVLIRSHIKEPRVCWSIVLSDRAISPDEQWEWPLSKPLIRLAGISFWGSDTEEVHFYPSQKKRRNSGGPPRLQSIDAMLYSLIAPTKQPLIYQDFAFE